MSAAPDWARDGEDWPNRAASRFVTAGGLRWHVQRMGAGPVLLLLHGTGAATHSWAELMPLLAATHDVIAIDLPGHGFTSSRASGFVSLPWMARVVADLLGELAVDPAAIVGHSAGAAIGLRMVLDGRAHPRAIVGLNAALLPFPGVAQHLFPALAKLLFLNPIVPRIMTWHADARAVTRLIEGTGSHLDARQKALYERLFRRRAHVEAALAMMANWDLGALAADLPKLAVPLTLVAAEGDTAVPPDQADRVAARVPSARVVRVAKLGHLAHEEDPVQLAAIVGTAIGGGAIRAGADASGSATARAAPPGPPRSAASGTAA